MSSYIGHIVYDAETAGTKCAQAEKGWNNPAVITNRADVEENGEGANDSDFGLSANALTDDLHEAQEFVECFEPGVVKVNKKTTRLKLHGPSAVWRTPRRTPSASKATTASTSSPRPRPST